MIENDLHGSLFVAVDVGDELLQRDVELLHFACQVRGRHTETNGDSWKSVGVELS